MRNDAGSLACATCGTTKPPGGGQVRCPACTMINAQGALKCTVCGTQLQAAAAVAAAASSKISGDATPAVGAATPARSDQSWECRCTFLNPLSATRCQLCDTSVHDIKANSAKGPDAAVIDAIKLIQDNPSMSSKDIKAELRRKGHTKGSTAARALLKAKKHLKNGTADEVLAGPTTLRQPSYTLRCGICDDPIYKGSSGNGKAATTTTCMCDHYFCFPCLGGYVAGKINAGAVTEEEMACPDPNCSESMLIGYSADGSMQFTPNYLYTRDGDQARGILGAAFPSKEAHALYTKFLHHRNRESGLYRECASPTCSIRLVPPEGQQFVRCQCGFSFCVKCDQPAHKGMSCEAARGMRKADQAVVGMKLQAIAEGGRWCPRCAMFFASEDPDPKKWNCDHMTCGSCQHQYCRNCGADRKLIVQNDNSFHHPKCGLYFPPEAGDTKTGRPTEYPDVWRREDPQFNSAGIEMFDGRPALKLKWREVGTSKDGRKCKKDCRCNYGREHSSWKSAGADDQIPEEAGGRRRPGRK
jgi:hypothetical protein